jgi:TolA-binding protein
MTAADTTAWREVAEKFPGTIPAGNAQIRIASALRAQGDLAGSAAELEKFTATFPEHPLLGAAWLTLGEIRQVQGDRNAALTAYRTASSRQKDSYAAPLAMISEARLLGTQGAEGEARAVLQSVQALYPETPAAMVAGGELQRMTPAAAVTPAAGN